MDREQKTRPALQRRGFNLVEAAIVLGVVGLIIGGIWVAASTVSEKRNEQLAYQGIMESIERLRNNYNGFDTSSLENHDLWEDPRTFDNVNGYKVHTYGVSDPWGHDISAYFNTVNYTGTEYVFEIHLNNINVSRCINLITRFAALPVNNLRYFSIGANWHGDEPRPYMPDFNECIGANRIDLYFLK